MSPLFLVPLLLGFSHSVLADASCINRGEPYKAITYVLVDRTDKPVVPDGLDQYVRRVAAMVSSGELSQGERLLVGSIEGRSSENTVFVDLVVPEEGWTSVPRKVRAQKKKIHQCLETLRSDIQRQPKVAKTSPILETIHSAVAPILAANGPKPRRLLIYSDMVQNGDVLSFYSKKGSLAPSTALSAALKEKLISNMSGARVLVAGAGGTLSETQARRVREFWEEYFQRSGAKLEFYGTNVGF